MKNLIFSWRNLDFNFVNLEFFSVISELSGSFRTRLHMTLFDIVCSDLGNLCENSSSHEKFRKFITCLN